MKKEFFLTALLASASLFGQMRMNPFESDGPQIGMQNVILAHVNNTTISVLDVKKKLDLLFHQSYPNLVESTQARFQFYQKSWRHVLMEMIDNELILADSVEKEMKLTDGEVREEMENRFGPNVMLTLDKIGLTYEETWKLVKNEMMVQRMAWFFIHSKAIQSVTPQEIRQAYRLYLKENPPHQEWKYRVISIRSETSDAVAPLSEEVYTLLVQSGESPESQNLNLKEFEKNHPHCSIQISTEYSASDLELSDLHREALSTLNLGEYGKPSIQTSRVDKKKVARIFYLSQKTDHPAPKFEEISSRLKNDLIQKAVGVESAHYLGKLRRHYGYDTAHLKESVPDNLNPFSLE